MRAASGIVLLMLGAGTLAAQAGGAVAGRVRDASSGQPLADAVVSLDDGRRGSVTDAAGAYRIREVRTGWHRLLVRMPGYRPAVADSVLVRSGETTVVDVSLHPQAVAVEGVTVEAVPDIILDPLATADVQRISGVEIRRLPITTLEEAVALSAGAVGESYRGGRVGQQTYILDGLGLKNQLDASTGPLGVRIPPDVLTEASLVTNGFSARYGQALSGVVNVVTRDGGERWSGRTVYELDRWLGDGGDYGFDRLVAVADGPIGKEGSGVRVLGVLDATGRIDADPVNAPVPEDPRDPRSQRPWLLPHNGGDQVDAALKLTTPLGTRHTLRLFGLNSSERRLLFDPLYKYDPGFAPARRVNGRLLSAHLQRTPDPQSAGGLVADLRVGFFDREFARGQLERPVGSILHPFSGHPFRIAGEDIARRQDTMAARDPIPGLSVPDWSEATPWGVPAFFRGQGSRGEVSWNRFRELRTQLDLSIAAEKDLDLYVGGELVSQRVQTFQRAFGYLASGIVGADTVPPPTASDFRPLSGAAYLEAQFRWEDLAFNWGIRYDQFDPRAELPGSRIGPRRSINPRFAVSTVLKNATFVASYGRFSQAPDFQYLVDAAFDDSARTGRFRRGNPNLGYENSNQYEFSLRVRTSEHVTLRLAAYVRQLNGLVASVPLGVNPDSTIFGNTDYGNVKGFELLAERELADWFGIRVGYSFQNATATATNAFQLLRRIRLDPTGDTIFPARVEFPLDYDRRHGVTAVLQLVVPDSVGVPDEITRRLISGLQAAAIVRVSSGLPFTMTNVTGDTLIGLPNSHRLPWQHSVDFLLRRSVRVAGYSGSVYVDVRNLLNRRNIDAVRRETGTPYMPDGDLVALAESAYQAHPEPIPYESPRYRAWADANGNGLLDGRGELFPLYLAAARDVTQPLFAFAPPRLMRFGVELVF